MIGKSINAPLVLVTSGHIVTQPFLPILALMISLHGASPSSWGIDFLVNFSSSSTSEGALTYLLYLTTEKEACKNVGQNVDDHFPDVRKMIVEGKGAVSDLYK